MIEEKKKLNPEQEIAAAHQAGPMLVVAGAGTGKTTILVERLKRLVESQAASGDEILLLTFTEKGAGEMKERAENILPYGYLDLWISTFHGFCEKILREHALDIGLDPGFRLVSTTEQWIIIKRNLERFNLDYYRPLGNPNKFIYELVKHFSKLKDEYISAAMYLDYALNLERSEAEKAPSPVESSGKKGGKEKGKKSEPDRDELKRTLELAEAYRIYNEVLLENSYLDFGDLIVYTLRLFEARPAILEYYRQRFKYIMIDEFQDTNWSQYELIKRLAAPRNDLMVVGDDDQSIYKFRGASLSNILQFKDDFPAAREVVLTRNYRSGQKILDTAYHFIRHNNPNRLEERIKIDKQLISGASYESEVRHLSFMSVIDEEEWVAAEIRRLKESEPEAKWSDFAILVRANSTADDYVAELDRRAIPNVFVSLRGLYYKSIILDVCAYLRLLDHYHESAALFRVLSMEVFKVEHSDIVALTRYARRKTWSLFEALRHIASVPDVSEAGRQNIQKLMDLIKRHSSFVKTEAPSQLFSRLVHESGMANKEYHENHEYFSLLSQFYERIKRFEKDLPGARLKDFLELLELELEAGDTGSLRAENDDPDKVRILTVHSSKGLEYRFVFIVNLVDKRFPSIGRKDKIELPESLLKEKLADSQDAHIEEERRLFYVALTRAKERLYLTSARDCGGVREKKASVFVAESDVLTEDMGEGKGDDNRLLRDIREFQNPVPPVMIPSDLPSRFSFSQIEAYANCPLQYRFNFILKIPIPSKPVMIFGRLMHNTLKDALLPLLESRQATLFASSLPLALEKKGPGLDDIIAIYKKYWSDEGYPDKETRAEYKKQGQLMLNIFWHSMEKEGWPSVAFIEKSFVFRAGVYIFKGSIDRVDRLPDGTYEVIDYKTGTPKTRLTYDDKRQLILYKLALEAGLGLKVSKLSFFYLKDGSTQSFVSTQKDEEKLQREIAETIEKIRSGIFPPQPSLLCAYCDFASICEFRQAS
jgi:DNA helicase-2/ATP-dependent DNA helicase PcrA